MCRTCGCQDHDKFHPRYRYNPDEQSVKGLLKKLLAETYLLYIQTQGAHWNVIGGSFPQLHTLFQTQYEELSTAVDLIAEQIRIFHSLAPATAAEFISLAGFQESPPSERADALVDALIEANKKVNETASALADAARENLDIQELAIQRMKAHGKAIWMLRSTRGHSSALRRWNRNPIRRWRRNPSIICNNCGTGNRAGRETCWKCGFDLGGSPSERMANIRRRAFAGSVFRRNPYRNYRKRWRNRRFWR